MRFTIRDVLWLMVVVAVLAGWYCHTLRQRADFRRAARTWGETIQSYKTEAARARKIEEAVRELYNAEFSRRAPELQPSSN